MKLYTTAILAFIAVTRAAMADDRPTTAAKWINISDPVVQKLTDEGHKPAWPGDTAGVAVDPASGDLFVVVAGQGLYRSADRGATFARCDGGKVGGRCETSYSINVDPEGKHLACFMLDGKCGLTTDGGATWQPMRDVGRNWDYAAVDWKSGGRNVLALRHESGGELYLSHDAGATWDKIDKDEKYAGVGIFDERTLVATKGDGILRSADGGRTWTKASDRTPIGRVAKAYKGATYWLTADGMLVSKDAGATWDLVGTSPPDATIGPWFKDERHWALAGKKGIFETGDAGQTWTPVAPLPEKFDVPRPGWFTNVAWDPVHDIWYASRMGKPTFRLQR